MKESNMNLTRNKVASVLISVMVILAFIIIPTMMYSQAPGSTATNINLAANAPSPVSYATASLVGSQLPGGRQFFYWVVAKYPIGNAIPYGPAAVFNVPTTLTVSNYVRISWTPVSGATGYDVLRTTSSQLPNGTSNIAVATDLTSTSYDNSSETISSYTVTSASGATASWTLDNQTYTLPVTKFSSDPIVPSMIGTSLPATCVVGQKFFKTDATAGSNLYLCTATNTWTQLSGGGSALSFTLPILNTAGTVAVNGIAGYGTANYLWGMNTAGNAVEWKAPATVITNVFGCAVTTTSTTVTVATPCIAKVGNVIYTLSSSAVYTVGGGENGTIFVYFSTSGTTAQVTMGLNNWATGSCDADCVAVQLTTTGYPHGATILGQVPVTGGNVGAFTDYRGAYAGGNPIVCGTGLGCVSNANGSLTINSTATETAFYSIREYVQTFGKQAGTANDDYGSQRWKVTSDAGCAVEAQVAPDAWGRPAGFAGTTAAGIGNYCGYAQNQSAANATIAGLNSVPAGGQADIWCTLTTPATITTIRLFCRGVTPSGTLNAVANTDAMGFYFDTGVNANWNITSCEGGACTSTDTGVAVAANTTYTLTLSSTTSDQWTWRVFTGATQSGTNTATLTNTPSGPLIFHVNAVALAASGRQGIWRAVGVRQVGL